MGEGLFYAPGMKVSLITSDQIEIPGSEKVYFRLEIEVFYMEIQVSRPEIGHCWLEPGPRG